MDSNIINTIILTSIAGFSTILGGIIALFIKKNKESYLSLAMGFASGVMIFISLVELLPQSIEKIGYLYAIMTFFLGMIFIYLIEIFIPHIYEQENIYDKDKKKNARLKKSGLLIAIGIAIHNFPEGIAVFLSSTIDIQFGISLALAITVHNIPEGIAIAIPVFYATKSRKKSLMHTFLSGIAEPIGAIIAFLFLRDLITETILYMIFSAVAGIMVLICFNELLPTAFKYKNKHLTTAGIVFGMIVIALSLILF